MSYSNSFTLIGFDEAELFNIGIEIGKQKNCKFFSLDSIVKLRTKMTSQAIREQHGESVLMQNEYKAAVNLQEIFQTQPFIILLTQEQITNPLTMLSLSSFSKIIYINVSERQIINNVFKDVHKDENDKLIGLPEFIERHRPKKMQDAKDIFHQYFEEKSAEFKRVADASFDVPFKESIETTATRFNQCRFE